MVRKAIDAPDASPVRSANKTPCADAPHGCAIGDLFHVLGKAHMLDLLHIFIAEEPGPKRFVELQKRLQISPNTLSERLKQLVEAGMLLRTVYNEIPPRVDYEATEKARDLTVVFGALKDWASKHDLKPAAPVAAAKA